MGFSSLANMSRRIPDGGRSAPRNSAVTGVGIHHNAGINAYGEATNPKREVSANYWITNDGTLIPNIDETRRAFTSGAKGYPAGANADHRNITVEVSNSEIGGQWRISDAAMKTLIALIADVYKRYGLGTVQRGAGRGVGVHQDWVPTACPGPYVMANIGSIIAEAEKIRTSGGTPSTPSVPGGSTAPTDSVDALAQAVIRGEYGNGADRIRRLGSRYAEVQARVNQILASGGATPSKPASVNIEELAKAVLRGEYGTGDERRRRLGNNYAAVQARVNQLVGVQPTTPAVTADIDTLARAVIRGDYGNGAVRKQKLGKNYAAVQARVNQILKQK